MKRWLPLLLVLVIWTSAQAQPQALPPVFDYADGKLLSGNWSYNLSVTGGGGLNPKGKITGFVFGFGRSEIAYCTALEAGAPSRLWTVSFSPEEIWKPGAKSIHVAQRLLFEAPAGVALRGPVWWSPDGTRVLVRGFADGAADLYSVEYASGLARRITHNDQVVDAAACPVRDLTAYVTEDENGRRSVFLDTASSSGVRRLGDGGINLRWSPDGTSLTWLDPKTATVWTEMIWERGAESPRESRMVPARSSEAVWSPDGALCADVKRSGEGLQLIISPSASAAGETLQFPEMGFQRLLGWAPDSNLIVALGEMNMPFLVSAYPPALDVQQANAAEAKRWDPANPGPRKYVEHRALLLPASISLEAGPPSWSSSMDMVAVVFADRLDPRHPFAQFEKQASESGEWRPELTFPAGQLAVSPVRREFAAPASADTEQIVYNMKNIALALQMYLADNDDTFPEARNIADLMYALQYYVVSDSVFRHPTNGRVIVKYLLPPEPLSLRQIRDPASLEVAIVESIPGLTIIAYGDGHVETKRR